MNKSNTFLIYGNEKLLISETRQQLKNNSKQQGFTDYRLLFIDKDFSWDDFYQELSGQSIFANQEVIDCLIQQKITVKLLDQLLEAVIIARDNHDITLILSIPELINKKTQKNLAFCELQKLCKIIPVYDVRTEQFASWLKNRIRTYNLKFDADAFSFFCEKNCGNLLSSEQELQKLASCTDKNINIDLLRSVLSDNANYNIFDFQENFLQKNAKKTIQILNSLSNSNISILLLIWNIAEDVRLLIKIKHLTSQNKKLVDIFKTLKIPAYKIKNLSIAHEKWQLQSLFAMLKTRYELEKIIKNYDSTSTAFIELERWIILNLI